MTGSGKPLKPGSILEPSTYDFLIQRHASASAYHLCPRQLKDSRGGAIHNDVDFYLYDRDGKSMTRVVFDAQAVIASAEVALRVVQNDRNGR